jgi:integrase
MSSRQLQVRRALQRAGGRLQFVEPKTASSLRGLVIPKLATIHLERHRARRDEERRLPGAAWQDYGLVFASSVGTPLEPRDVNRRWDELHERGGLHWLRLHDLRHGSRRSCLPPGCQPERSWMFSVTPRSVTMNTYTHVLMQLQEDAADAIDGVLGG